MKTNPFMLNGKAWSVLCCNVIGLLLCLELTAQTISYNFVYRESVRSDYGRVFGKTDSGVREDSALHSGTLTLTVIDDGTVGFKMMTEQLTNTSVKNISRPQAGGYFFLDTLGRIVRIAINKEAAVILPAIRPWIAELNLHLATGTISEQKADGTVVSTAILTANGGESKMHKTAARYLNDRNSRSAMVVDQYEWQSVFDNEINMPLAIRFLEKKRQAIGRRITACVNRELQLLRISSVVPQQEVQLTDTVHIDMFRVLTDEERVHNIARSLLKNESLDTLLAQARRMTGMELEERFRLKSRIRSALILNASALQAVMKEYQGLRPGSHAVLLLEDAVIEANTAPAREVVRIWLKQSDQAYEDLKDLVLRIGLANAIDAPIARELLRIRNSSKDENSRNLVELALSNYALPLKYRDEDSYRELSDSIMLRYQKGINDTLQYLYVVGNAGIAEGEELVTSMYNVADAVMKEELIFGLRNMKSMTAERLIYTHLMKYHPAADVFTNLIGARQPGKMWLDSLIDLVKRADKAGDSTYLGTLQYLLDNAYRDGIDLQRIVNLNYSSVFYRKEVEDFILQGGLCGQKLPTF